MALEFSELNSRTRDFMLREFDAEQAGGLPYEPRVLSAHGLNEWPGLMREAINRGNDETLTAALRSESALLNSHETWAKGVRVVNHFQASERLAMGEFNTAYVRGLTALLLEEGVDQVEVYRAAPPKWQSADCAAHEGVSVSAQKVYDGHRSRYWPVEDSSAFSIPFHAGCHHSVRRLART